MQARFIREIHRATPINHRTAIRQKIARAIENRGPGNVFPLSFSVGRRETDRFLLCGLANGRKIFLPTSYKKQTFLVVFVRKERNRILADVYTKDGWNRYVKRRKKGEKRAATKEVFLIKENNTIYYEAKKIDLPKPKVNKKESPEASEVTKIRMRGRYIESWWQCKTDEDPKPYETQVNTDGYIRLCSFQGASMPLLIGRQFSGRTVIVSFRKGERSRIVIVRLKGKRNSKEFWLVRNGTIFNRPVPKYEEAA